MPFRFCTHSGATIPVFDASLRGGSGEILPKLFFSVPMRVRGRWILSLGCEGGGVSFYRCVRPDGGVEFTSHHQSGGLLDEDEDPYVDREDGPYGSLREAIDASVGNQVFFFNLHMHPDAVDDFREYIKGKLESLSEDDRRLGDSVPVPDSCLDWANRF
ncbi:MAG: hypothetical protein WBD22_09225 [Pyrinomonadaceae bacterium]